MIARGAPGGAVPGDQVDSDRTWIEDEISEEAA